MENEKSRASTLRNSTVNLSNNAIDSTKEVSREPSINSGVAPSDATVNDEENVDEYPSTTGKDSTQEAAVNAEATGEQYPHGLRLALVVVALVLSIFLVALDMVCHFISESITAS